MKRKLTRALRKRDRLNERFLNIKTKLRTQTEACLRAILESAGGRIEVPEDRRGDIGYETTVSYDGGNHPEYASNVFSIAYGAFLTDHGVSVICEDCDDYDIDRIWDIEELNGVIDMLLYCLDHEKENS